MDIASFSVKNPVLVNLLMVSVLVIGLLFAVGLPLELFPSIKLETVTVTTVYPGASSEDIEQLVTIPIEEEINNISGIELVRSVSSEGRSLVIAELETGEDTQAIAQDIDSNISRIKDQLPDDAEEPVVEEVKSSFPLINIALAGNVKKEVLRSNALRLRDKLQLIEGVDNITTSGMDDPVFWVNLNPLKLRQYGISVSQITDAIARRNIDLPGGGIDQDKFEYLVRTRGRIREVNDLENIPVKKNPDGKNVMLQDVSTIRLGEEEARTKARVNGLPAITFLINKQKNIDAIETVKRIKTTVKDFKKTVPPSIKIYETNNNSYWVKKRFNTMLKSGSIGLLVVLFCLGAFLNLRAAVIAAIGIPVSFFGAFMLMSLTGITLNLLSMFGLILVLGIVVDDAIIVVENVQRHISSGVDPFKAAIEGTKEVTLPVLATVLTNIAAFIPLLFATGLVGEFLSIIPTVAIYALLISLLEALLIMPSHCADYLKPVTTDNSRKWVQSLRKIYIKGLFFTIRKRYLVVSSFVLIFALSIFVTKNLPVVFFYIRDASEFIIRVENPAQSNLDYTEDSVRKVEKIVKDVIPDHALKNTLSLLGLDVSTGETPVFGDHLGSIIVQYEDFEKRSENGKDMMNEVRRKTESNIAGPAKVDFIINAGPPTGKPVDVRLQGENYSTLKKISSKVQHYLQGIPGVYGVSDDLVLGKPEVKVVVNENKAGVYGLDTISVAREIRALIDGLTVAKTRVGKEEADIKLKYDLPGENIISLLESHQIKTPHNSWITLGSIARFERVPGMLDIKRYDYQRSVSVTSEIDQKITTSNEVNNGLKSYLEKLIKGYPGYSFKLAGEQEEFGKTLGDIIRASIVAILLIYMILAAILKSYTQPLIIMSILPFTSIGVVTGVLLRGEPITLPAIIGTVALLGIVVNDSLVLMDFINKRASKMNRVFAVAYSAKYRFRPIILTTITTFGGLSTLMYQMRGEASFLAPMAIALGFGLVFATVITLYLIPSLYLILDDGHNYIKRKMSQPEIN